MVATKFAHKEAETEAKLLFHSDLAQSQISNLSWLARKPLRGNITNRKGGRWDDQEELVILEEVSLTN